MNDAASVRERLFSLSSVEEIRELLSATVQS
jgi:hypothetical protein